MTDALVPNKMPEPLVRQVASTVKITYVGKGEILELCIKSASTQPVETRELEKQDKYLYVIRSGAMEQREADGVLRARLGSEDVFGFTFLDSSVSGQKRIKPSP